MRAVAVIVAVLSVSCDGDPLSSLPTARVDLASRRTRGYVHVDVDHRTFGAAFFPMLDCRPSLVAGCYVDECSHNTPFSGPRITDGSVKLTSPSLGQLELRLDSPAIEFAQTLPPGESIAMRVAGGMFDGDAATLAVPSALTDVTIGDCAVGASRYCAFNTAAQPFARWQRIAVGQVLVSFRIDGEGRAASVQCVYDGRTGFGRLPHAVQQRLPRAELGAAAAAPISSAEIARDEHVTTFKIRGAFTPPLEFYTPPDGR
jgi:hypothetical protein